MKAGRKPHEPTEQGRKQVEALASYGVPLVDIARVIGVSAPTVAKWYPYELETGHVRANSMVAQSLYNKAMGNGQGAVTACIFWLKCRAGWVEPRPWDDAHAMGKKELQQQAAATAGEGTEWGDDLKFDGRAN